VPCTSDVPVIPDDDPTNTCIFTLKDLRKSLTANETIDEATVEKVIAILAEGKTVEVNDGMLYIVPAGIGLFEVYVKE
jgi:hypothetical protein